jgi:hypothetical protein
MPSPNACDAYGRAADLAVEPDQRAGAADDPYLDDPALRRQLLSANAEALAALRAGLATAAYVEPAWEAQAAVCGYRRLERVLRVEQLDRTAEGRWAAAFDSQLDGLRLAFDAQRGSSLVSALVGWACQAIAEAWTLTAERVTRLSGPEARAALRRMSDLAPRRPTLAEILATDKADTLASLADRLTQRRSKYGKAPWFRWAAELFGHAWWDGLQRCLDDLVAWADQPYGTPPPDVDSYGPLARAGSCATPSLQWQSARSEAGLDLLWTAVALRVWQAEHGAPPDSLDQLVPGLLPAVPRDPFVDQPLRYRREGANFVLYSVGPDRVDDGGRPATRVVDGKEQPGLSQESKGDMVWGHPW